MRKFLVALLLVLPAFAGFRAIAQQNNTEAEEVKESAAIVGNLDSLLNLWYVKNSVPDNNRASENIYGYSTDEVPTFSDSVYASRISKIASPIPFVYNDKVKGFIDLYTVKKRDLSEKILGLSTYYFPVYEEILDKYDMPLELKYLSIVESALNTRATSRCGAAGLWQFMYSTGKLYSLDINSYIDERRDPYKETEAAALYLKDLHDIFGDWFLAIAAYNCGPGNVNKAIKRSGGKRTFWEIYRWLPAETRGYVPAFIAATYSFTYHIEHNLYPQKIALPVAVDTVLVDKDVDFSPIATVLGVPIDEIRDLNPQFKKDHIPSHGTPYVLRLPAHTTPTFCTFRDSIYVCSSRQFKMTASKMENNPFEVEPLRGSPGNDSNHTASAEPEKAHKVHKTTVYYVVKKGDNINMVAEWFDVSIYSLKRWNSLKSNKMGLGRRLQIYVPEDDADYYRHINKMTLAQKRKLGENHGGNYEETSSKTVASKTVSSKDKTAVAKKHVTTQPHLQYYTVQKGDTLWSIAQHFPGVTVEDIKKANNLDGKNRTIRVGQKIKISKA